MSARQSTQPSTEELQLRVCELERERDELVQKMHQLERERDALRADAERYRRARRWHPRLQASYWTGQWWEPLYGDALDARIDSLDEVPQPTPHSPQDAARTAQEGLE